MTITGSWISSPERAIQTEAGPFIVAYHGGNRATVRSDPYEINHRNAPAGDIHLKQGTFRAVTAELTYEPDADPETFGPSWTFHHLTGYRTDRYTPGLSEPISPLFAKEWVKLVFPAILQVLSDEAFLAEGENAMISRNLASLSGGINRLREAIEKQTEELRALETARAGILQSLTPEQVAAIAAGGQVPALTAPGVRFVIVGPPDPEDPLTRLYWSNDDGWVDRESATVFDDPNVNNPVDWHHREAV